MCDVQFHPGVLLLKNKNELFDPEPCRCWCCRSWQNVWKVVSMSQKRTHCTESSLFCDVCTFLDSIGDIGSDSASRKIRCAVRKEGGKVEYMGHRRASTTRQCWDHTVWTCDAYMTYTGAKWDGLKEDCHIYFTTPSTYHAGLTD